jgi:glutaredoxin
MIIIYGMEDCKYCKRAVALAISYNLKYEYRDAQEWKEMFLENFPNAKTVPQIIWDDRRIGGYTEFASEVENTIGGYGDGTF